MAHLPYFGQIDIFTQKRTSTLFSVYWTLTSSKKSEKSNEVIQKKQRYRRTKRRANGRTNRTEFIAPSGWAMAPIKPESICDSVQWGIWEPVKHLWWNFFLRLYRFLITIEILQCPKLVSACHCTSEEAVVRRCSAKKVFLKILQNSQENTCARASFSSALGLQLY